MSTPAQLPSIGRNIHDVLRDGRHAGEARAAIVTNTFGGARCNGSVFLDAANDDGSEDSLCSVDYDDTVIGAFAHGGSKYTPGTWHWPPRV